MAFRFRRSTRLGPLRFNYRFAGLRLQQGWIELDLRWGRGNSLLSSRVARFARLSRPTARSMPSPRAICSVSTRQRTTTSTSTTDRVRDVIPI